MAPKKASTSKRSAGGKKGQQSASSGNGGRAVAAAIFVAVVAVLFGPVRTGAFVVRSIAGESGRRAPRTLRAARCVLRRAAPTPGGVLPRSLFTKQQTLPTNQPKPISRSKGHIKFPLPYPATGRFVHPVPKDVLPWRPRPLEGAFAPNAKLQQAARLFEGRVHGSESVAVAPDGKLVMLDKFNQVWEAEARGDGSYELGEAPVADLGAGRPLGYHFDAAGDLLVADSFKVCCGLRVARCVGCMCGAGFSDWHTMPPSRAFAAAAVVTTMHPPTPPPPLQPPSTIRTHTGPHQARARDRPRRGPRGARGGRVAARPRI